MPYPSLQEIKEHVKTNMIQDLEEQLARAKVSLARQAFIMKMQLRLLVARPLNYTLLLPLNPREESGFGSLV